MKLKHPSSKTKMFRRRNDVWHVQKREQVGLCGRLITINKSMDEIERSTLGEITKGKICPSCWPWGVIRA
jgi:hypothetical protein